MLRTYKSSKRQVYIDQIKEFLEAIYETPDLFKYIMENVYTEPRNPFTNGYHTFMSHINSGTDIETALYFVADALLDRRLKEKQLGTELAVF